MLSSEERKIKKDIAKKVEKIVISAINKFSQEIDQKEAVNKLVSSEFFKGNRSACHSLEKLINERITRFIVKIR
jgi:hydrogenase maturation factor HypF (carbamoyltransferase family)